MTPSIQITATCPHHNREYNRWSGCDLCQAERATLRSWVWTGFVVVGIVGVVAWNVYREF